MTGYFSLIQYCPDPARAEAANVGLVLLCPEMEFLKVRVTTNHDRVRRFFEVKGQALTNLQALEKSLQSRIEGSKAELTTAEAFTRFAKLRVNQLVMTPPTSVRVLQPIQTLNELFEEFVGVPAQRKTSRSKLRPLLNSLFHDFVLLNRAERNFSVEVPVVKRAWEVDFAYMNGVQNLVKVQSIAERGSEAEALRSVAEWDLVRKHGTPEMKKASLTVTLPLPNDKVERENRDAFVNLYREYGAHPVLEEDFKMLEEKVNKDLGPVQQRELVSTR